MPIYIEDVSPETLKSLIQSDDELKFKHKDCSMVFTSEGDHLYAQDVDSHETDLFAGGDFAGSIQKHYGNLTPVVELLESLSTVGMPLELADFYCTFNLPASELQKVH
tara:strand:- start:80 stop:403 length:324 start_codon:yes stop_codon:yes gene_type:complete